MVLKKYERWPFAIIDEEGNIWRRSKPKGWFKFVHFDNRKSNGGYCSTSKFINDTDFIGCKRIMSKNELISYDNIIK